MTPRLRLARLCAADLADLCRMHRDPRVMATLGGVRSDDETAAFLERELAHWERHGFGLWTARVSEAAPEPAPAGEAAVSCSTPPAGVGGPAGALTPPAAARRVASSGFVGRGGLRRVTIGGRDEVEVAYALMPEHWRHGLASELAEASVRAAFDVLGLGELVSFTQPANAASRRVMEKAGFRYERDVEHAGLLHVLYRLRGT